MTSPIFLGDPIQMQVSMDGQVKEKPERVYWFEKKDGTKFCCGEAEAWNILKGRVQAKQEGQIQPVRHKYLGVSDSLTYYAALKEAYKVHKEKGIEEARRILKEGMEAESLKADPTILPSNQDVSELTPGAKYEFLGSRMR